MGGMDHALEDGMGIIAYPAGSNFAKPEVDMIVNIAFDDIEAVKGKPIVGALRQFSHTVEHIIEQARKSLFS